MGLYTIIRKNRMKSKEMRILFLGLDNAGKTTILKYISHEDTSKTSPTLGFNIKTLSLPDSPYTLNIWDVGGQRTLRPYWRNYFEQTDAIVWVVDSADRMRLNDCKEELHALLTEDRLAGASLLVLANKQDLPGALGMSDIELGLSLNTITTHNWKIFASSAMTGAHVFSGLQWVVNDVAARLYYYSSVGHADVPQSTAIVA
ncbi:GTP-binding protein [Cylindrobasidium torrendii FP15055 ss-10]|uniref:ADP-ribosylation factor-like protein 2 n=1 Tax=Cylindrobasidium torrendii FP15055 ss-10 TaxID=1314674 RepID=A0A0D7BSB9_9AGAR|nr:GTP-binding protein [Cylindrobasidium torrendii FP15055 ss-10]